MQLNTIPTAKHNTFDISYKSLSKIRLKTIPQYFESTNWYRKNNVSVTEQEKIDFLSKINELSVKIQQRGLLPKPLSELKPSVQRGLDLVFSSILALPAAALVLISASITKLVQPNLPVFHKQHRYGLNGKVFDVIKIRTVEKTQDGWRKSSKFARFLRKYSIDELPQLLNVFKGDMSLSGPRAFIFRDLKLLAEDCGEEFAAQRLLYKPGFGFGYEKNRTLKQPRAELEKDFFENHGIKTYFKTIMSLAKTIIKGNNE